MDQASRVARIPITSPPAPSDHLFANPYIQLIMGQNGGPDCAPGTLLPWRAAPQEKYRDSSLFTRRFRHKKVEGRDGSPKGRRNLKSERRWSRGRAMFSADNRPQTQREDTTDLRSRPLSNPHRTRESNVPTETLLGVCGMRKSAILQVPGPMLIMDGRDSCPIHPSSPNAAQRSERCEGRSSATVEPIRLAPDRRHAAQWRACHRGPLAGA
ncbi:hypothetical protein B0T24DRAFT_588778 [Lasiosphaeria ovina]|uniref:Uncharacterized protein n=1 Tax=Lasiosphaeria ovina TaxID=92902 RepID=A0AAE0TYG9_9PEZI|nr:hypothetical protein B0T24DRAFT_588778 [Lasiosphaeria ovina]